MEAPERDSATCADALDTERETEAAVDARQYGAKRRTADSDGDGKAKPVYPKPRASSKVCILSIDGGKRHNERHLQWPLDGGRLAWSQARPFRQYSVWFLGLPKRLWVLLLLPSLLIHCPHAFKGSGWW